MSLLSIPSYKTDDPNYRYKMPRLVAKVEGRGNGIKTNIVNMGDIARCLKRPPEYPTKFCGHELGAQSKFDIAEGKAIVNGAHEQKDLQQLIDKFIDKFVLCENCSLPEIDLSVKKSRVCYHCNACGHSNEVDNVHKLATFILRNPPDGGDSTMGQKNKGTKSTKSKEERQKEKAAKAARKAAKGGDEDGDDCDEDGGDNGDDDEDCDGDDGAATEGVKKQKSKKSKDRSQGEKAGAVGADGVKVAKSESKKSSKKSSSKKGDKSEGAEGGGVKEGSDAGDADNNSEGGAVESRDTAAVDSAAAAAEEKKRRKAAKKEGKDSSKVLIKEELTYDSPELESVRARLFALFDEGRDGSDNNNKKLLPTALFDTARLLQVSQDFSHTVRLFVVLESIFRESEEGSTIATKKLGDALPYIAKMAEGMSARDVLTAFEDFMSRRLTDAAYKTTWPYVLQVLYNGDVLDEEQILNHYKDKASGKPGSPEHLKAKTAAKPFLTWLQENAGSDDDDEDDENSTKSEEDEAIESKTTNKSSIKELGQVDMKRVDDSGPDDEGDEDDEDDDSDVDVDNI